MGKHFSLAGFFLMALVSIITIRNKKQQPEGRIKIITPPKNQHKKPVIIPIDDYQDMQFV